jgi:hypothetical protein
VSSFRQQTTVRSMKLIIDNYESIFRYKKLVVNRILNDAFAELLEWDDYFVLPETLAMDAKRIIALRDAVERMAVSTGVILLVRFQVFSIKKQILCSLNLSFMGARVSKSVLKKYFFKFRIMELLWKYLLFKRTSLILFC